MVAGHLQEKNGYWYAVLNYTDPFGKRKAKWVATGLTVKGNKKRAEAMLAEARQNFEAPATMQGDILFADFLEDWLTVIRNSVAVPTYASYSSVVNRVISPHFRNGKRILVASDTTKTKSSMRTLPLMPFMREKLLAVKAQQEENRRLCGRCYKRKHLDYVCVNDIGELINPHYVTEQFPKLLKANGLRHIRFHDLRHPYVKHTTKIFSLRLKFFQAQPVSDALRKTRRAFQQPFPYEQNGLPKQTVL